MSEQDEKIINHYASGYEAKRLDWYCGQLERDRTRKLLLRFLPSSPAMILDIGGGQGGHACWLATRGHHVHLTDIVPLHVEMAITTSGRQPEAPLASATVGDARSVSWSDEYADAVLLLGPLYHLTEKADRGNQARPGSEAVPSLEASVKRSAKKSKGQRS